MNKIFKLIFTALLALAIVGCTSLAKPRDVRDNLAYGWAGYTAVVKSLTIFVKNDVLTKEQVRKVQPELLDARNALADAQILIDAGLISESQSKIDTANKILRLLKRLIEQERAKNTQANIVQTVTKLVPV